MDLNLTDNQEMLRNVAREFLSAHCAPSLVKEMESDERGYPPDLWQRMAEMGWLGVMLPGEYGGGGGDFLDLLVLMQEMGRTAVPGPFFATAVLGGLAILEGGDPHQRETLLPRLCAGDILLSLALSEPESDFGLDHLSTTAVEQDGRYVINGTKLFVPEAHVAEMLLCVTSGTESVGAGFKPAQAGVNPKPTPTHKSGDGLSVFLVKTERPDVSMTPLEAALRGRHFEVRFENTQVERKDALGTVGQARGWMERVLDKAMVAKCAEMVGAGQKLLEMTVEYAKVRVQFGRPIGALQAIQHHCANLATCIESAELMTYRAGWMLAQGLPCRREVLQAKAWANEACKLAAALGHQVHGGIGFTREYDLYLYSGCMTTSARLLGGTEWCYEGIAREMGLSPLAPEEA